MVTCDIAPSVDGYVAGPNQSLENPFGEEVDERLHRWMFWRAEENAEAIAPSPPPVRTSWGRNRRASRRKGSVDGAVRV